MTEPWLSVIMPTYNGAHYLAEALESVVQQRDIDGIELIAVDDGSTDDTLTILERYQRELPMHVVARPRVGNWVAGTNEGLRLARGRFACFLHQDDLWLPGRLDAVKEDLRRTRTRCLLIHESCFIDSGGHRLGTWRCPLPVGADLDGRSVMERLLVQNFVSVGGTVFSRMAALDLGGLDETLWYTADWDLWLHLAAAGSVRYLDRPLSAFRIHPSTQTTRRSTDPRELRRQQEAVLERHVSAWSQRWSGRPPSEAAARFSIEANVALSQLFHGSRPELIALFRRFVRLGPKGWSRYLRDSRITERAGARLRIGLAQRLSRT